MILYSMAAEAAKKQAQKDNEAFEATISRLLANRLTDRKVAEDLRTNIEGLAKAGIEPDMANLRYVKLAEFEDAQEVKSIHNEDHYSDDNNGEWYE